MKKYVVREGSIADFMVRGLPVAVITCAVMTWMLFNYGA